MSRKKYTNPEQRKVLESVGIPHIKGRSYDEAQQLIEELVEAGTLPPHSLSPPTAQQLERLSKYGVEPPDDLTKEAAAQLLQTLAETNPASEKQLRFIEDLGGIADRLLSVAEASDFISYLEDRVERCPYCQVYHNRRSNRCTGCGRYRPDRTPIRPPRPKARPGFIARMSEWIRRCFGTANR